jgi:hypothetical protein
MMNFFRISSLLPLIVLSMILPLSGCSGEIDIEDLTKWEEEPPVNIEWREAVPPPNSAEYVWESRYPQNNDLYAIWGFSAEDIFTVGSNGTILHFNGKTWSPMDSPTSESLYGIWGTASNNVYVTGENGTLLRYDGVSWKVIDSGTNMDLHKIWGSSSDDIFITTIRFAKILHYDGNGWDILTTPLEERTTILAGIWGTSPYNVYAVGSFNAILHWDGYEWEAISRREKPEDFVHITYGIWGSAADDIYVVDGLRCIKHYDGKSWRKIRHTEHDVMSIWGTASDNVYAVGRANFYASILHYNGNEWIEMGPKDPILNIYLNDVWGSSENDIYIVGDEGVILHYSGN